MITLFQLEMNFCWFFRLLTGGFYISDPATSLPSSWRTWETFSGPLSLPIVSDSTENFHNCEVLRIYSSQSSPLVSIQFVQITTHSLLPILLTTQVAFRRGNHFYLKLATMFTSSSPSGFLFKLLCKQSRQQKLISFSIFSAYSSH